MALAARKLSIQFTAIGARIRKKLLDASVLKEIEGATADHANGILEEIREYPGVPPNSTYTRTQELYNSWKIRRGREGQNIVYFITNDATDYRGRSYATFVQGTYQTPMHASAGWKNINDYTKRSSLQYTVQGILTRAAASFSVGS